jgi:PadR family transcriptional regulator, regulatory protein PadR
MEKRTTRKGQQYRHTPAFILLLLAQSEAYGASLMIRLESELPAYRTDSAVIYRTLQDLEKTGAVESHWEHEQSGPPRKWYRITEIGRKQLKEYREDIAMRHENLSYFLKVYENISE